MSESTAVVKTERKKMSRDYSLPADEAVIERSVKALEANGFTVEVVKDLKEAKERVEAHIPHHSEVFTATSVTLDEAGLTSDLNESGKWVSVRDMFMPLYSQADKAVEMRRIGSGSDYTVGSVHAITETGKVLVASASGSQLPNYVYGASNVIWVVGAQKIVSDIEEAMERLETYTFPLEDKRALAAYGSHSVISKTLVYHKDPHSRVRIIIVKESIGY